MGDKTMKNKVTIIGAGTVGASIAYTLAARDLASDILLIDINEAKAKGEAMDIFNQAMENLKPVLEVKARRVGGSTYQVPMEIRAERRQTLAIRWLVNAARNRSEKTMKERLAGELMDAYNNAGSAIKKKEEVHRMAEANKAFAHYRW